MGCVHFYLCMIITEVEFAEIVDAAWMEIPEYFRDQMENTEVVIEREPQVSHLQRVRVNGKLLGLFEGVPKTAWGLRDAVIPPNKITIFQDNILACNQNIQDLKIMVKVVLMHEVAHYFGFREDQMFILDQKLRKRLSNA